MVRMRRRCAVAEVRWLWPRINVDVQHLSIFSCSRLFHCCCCSYQLGSLNVITADAGQCHWSDQTLVKKMPGTGFRRRRVARGPWWAAYWNQTFSQQADPLLLLLLTLLSVDTRTFCSCQARIPSFAPSPSYNQLPDTRLFCCSQSAASERGLYYPIPSPSFAITSTFLCKSLNSWVTKILTFFLRVALAGEKSTEKHLEN